MWACIIAFSSASGMNASSTLSCTMALPENRRIAQATASMAPAFAMCH
jgi:hypothetical protein